MEDDSNIFENIRQCNIGCAWYIHIIQYRNKEWPDCRIYNLENPLRMWIGWALSGFPEIQFGIFLFCLEKHDSKLKMELG